MGDFEVTMIWPHPPTFYNFQAKITCEPRAVFYLDAPSASVCLLIQLEKHATEEGGVTASVYSRKDPVCIGIFLPLLLLFSQEFELLFRYYMCTYSIWEHLLSIRWACHLFINKLLVLA